MSSSRGGQRAFANLLRLLSSKKAIAAGIVTAGGAGIYYLDATNPDRFQRQMVRSMARSTSIVYYLNFSKATSQPHTLT